MDYELLQNNQEQKYVRQDGAELCQAQVKLDNIVVMVVEVVVKANRSSTTIPGGWVVGLNEINTNLNFS